MRKKILNLDLLEKSTYLMNKIEISPCLSRRNARKKKIKRKEPRVSLFSKLFLASFSATNGCMFSIMWY